MRIDHALHKAKAQAQLTQRPALVVHDARRAGANVAEAFHCADEPGLVAFFPDAERIAAVYPDGRVIAAPVQAGA